MIPETAFGINGFATAGRAVPGTFKNKLQSFVVDEISRDASPKEGGKYLIARIRLTDWETNRFVTYLAKKLGISRKRVTYAGTKDKFGITSQLFCVNYPGELSGVDVPGAEVLESWRSDAMISLGDLRGNRFTVDLDTDGADQQISDICNQLNSLGGFPNFFGYQRFGSLRPITHRVGKLLVQGLYEDAVMEYLVDPQTDKDRYRLYLHESKDFKRAVTEYPSRLSYERALLQWIVEKDSLEGAFSVLPKNLQIMFVHAYQSYLFNLVLSNRLQSAEQLSNVGEGESFVEVDELFNPVGEQRKSNKANAEMLNLLAKSDKIRPVIPLVGAETDLPRDSSDPLNLVLDAEGVAPKDFRIRDHPELTSTGSCRIVSSKPIDLEIRGGVLSFSLGRGTYASSFVREILKENMYTAEEARSARLSEAPS